MRVKAWDFFSNRRSTSGVLEEFIERLSVVYGGLNKKEQSAITGVIQHMFRKWYYSALIPDTYITPGNIVNSQVEGEFKGETMILPAVEPRYKDNKFEGFSWDIVAFNRKDHYFVRDIVSLLRIFTPDAGVDEDGMLLEEDRERLSYDISILDAYYIEYLNHMAWELGLLRKLPSIGGERAQVSPKGKAFLQLGGEEKLDRVVEGAIRMASKELSEAFPAKWEPFSPKKIENLLKKPTETGEFFESLFAGLDIDIFELSKKVKEDWQPTEEDEIMPLMVYFSLGVLFDMWFLTPFGHYLQLIQPLYLEPYNLQREVEDILLEKESQREAEFSVFAPCDEYDITPLGEQVILKGKKSSRRQEMDPELGDEQLFDILIKSRVFGVFSEEEGQRVL